MIRCKGCGKAIIFGRDQRGQLIPLDLVAPVYALIAPARLDDQVALDQEVAVSRDKAALVSHFATCPKASEFSGKARAARSGGRS